MIYNNHYLNKLYNDLVTNSPKTISMNICDLGATEEMLDGIADGTLIMQGGYKVLDRDEVKEILRQSM